MVTVGELFDLMDPSSEAARENVSARLAGGAGVEAPAKDPPPGRGAGG